MQIKIPPQFQVAELQHAFRTLGAVLRPAQESDADYVLTPNNLCRYCLHPSGRTDICLSCSREKHGAEHES